MWFLSPQDQSFPSHLETREINFQTHFKAFSVPSQPDKKHYKWHKGSDFSLIKKLLQILKSALMSKITPVLTLCRGLQALYNTIKFA